MSFIQNKTVLYFRGKMLRIYSVGAADIQLRNLRIWECGNVGMWDLRMWELGNGRTIYLSTSDPLIHTATLEKFLFKYIQLVFYKHWFEQLFQSFKNVARKLLASSHLYL
jgi:hypothetical protein